MSSARTACLAVLVLTLVQLLVGTFGGLSQFDGKGFGYRLIAYPVLMLAVPAAWWLTHRGPHAEPPWTAWALIMAPFLIDVTGNTANLYDTIPWWDDANHFVNWALLNGGIGLLLARLAPQPRWILVAAITGVGAALAVAWELGEWYTFIRRGTELTGAYQDTLGDETLGTLGALLAGVLVERHTRPEGVPLAAE